VVVATAVEAGTRPWEAAGADLVEEAEGADSVEEAAEASAEVGASEAMDSMAEVASAEVGSGVASADSVAAVFEEVDFGVDSAAVSTAGASMGSVFMIRSFPVITAMDTAIPITTHMRTIRITATRLMVTDITGPQLEL
jgi:hypothetical protein